MQWSLRVAACYRSFGRSYNAMTSDRQVFEESVAGVVTQCAFRSSVSRNCARYCHAVVSENLFLTENAAGVVTQKITRFFKEMLAGVLTQ